MTEEERAERADAIVYSCDSRAELASYIVRLEAERDDLRELVRYMWEYDYAGYFSTLQGHQDHSAIVYQRMRELGVEVEP